METETSHHEEDAELLTSSEAARHVGVTVRTLHRWEEQGRITARRTLGGHRRYSRNDLNALVGAA